MIHRGGEAGAFLKGRGFEALGSPHAVADDLRGEDLAAIRLWHTAARGRLTCGAGRVLVVLQLDGVLEWRDGSGTAALSAGDTLVVPGGVALAASAPGPTARIELELGLRARPAPVPTILDSERSGWARSAVVSLVNAALNAELTADDPAFPLFASAVRASVLALLQPPRPVGRTEALFERALLVIHAEAADPSLSIGRLAERLGVTRQHLTAVFARHGSPSPALVLRSRRAALARRYLDEQRPGRRPSLREIAAATGFGSEDSLQRALRSG